MAGLPGSAIGQDATLTRTNRYGASVPHQVLRILCCLLAAPAAAQTTFPTRIVADFGGLRDDPAEELTAVSSVVRLAGGTFLVGSQKPAEVRLYDATGKMIRRYGRAGNGPGEFRGGALVRPWSGDSVLTLTTGSRRWMLFETGGRLVREWPMDSLHPHPVTMELEGWAYHRTGTPGSRGCFAPAVAKIPAPSPWAPREAVTDPAGRVWIRSGATMWRIHSPAGEPLGTAILPPEFIIHQFSGDLVIGQRLDDDDAVRIVAVEVRLPAASPAGTTCPPPAPPTPAARRMRVDMANARTAAEAVRSDTGIYPKQIPPSLVVIAEGTDTEALVATAQTWVFMLKDRKSPLRCISSIGPRGLPGWQDGALACSEK